MAFIPVPNTVQVSLGFELPDAIGSNNFHVSKATPWSLADMALLSGYINTWLQAFPKASFPTSFRWLNYRIMDLQTENSPVLEDIPTPSVIGTSVSPAMPNNCAFVVTFRTANRGRSYRGRVYQAGLSENICFDNNVAPTFATAVEGWWDDWLSNSPPVSSYLSVASRYTANQPRVSGINTPVAAITTNLRIDTQRRRMPR